MTEIRLVVRCESNPMHAKILRIPLKEEEKNGIAVRRLFRLIGDVLDGSSTMYIHAPSDKSPIGFCGLCRGKLKCMVQKVEV